MYRLLQAMANWNGELSTGTVCWMANNEVFTDNNTTCSTLHDDDVIGYSCSTS